MAQRWMVCFIHHRVLKVQKNTVYVKVHEHDLGYYTCDLWTCPEEGCALQLFTGWSAERFGDPPSIDYILNVQH